MSKKGVADAIGVAPIAVHRWESGLVIPIEENVRKLAQTLEFPEIFFFGADIDRPRRDNASFRGLASKTDRIMDAALASGAMAYLFDDWISARVGGMPELDLPELPSDIAPEVASRLVRQHWRLGEKPIENMVHLLEAKGIRVFSLAENTKDVDAFSVWRNDQPYVFLNRFKSAERSRFDAAHELAHLCLHKHGGATADQKNSPVEKEANAFAGAFLMPEADLRAVITSSIYRVDELLVYKRRWRVAAVALAYRAREIGLITEARSNSFYVEMSRRGWLKTEPLGIAREQSHIWQEAMDGMRRKGWTKADISQQTGVPVGDLEALLFGLANMITIDGSGAKTPARKVQFRVVR